MLLKIYEKSSKRGNRAIKTVLFSPDIEFPLSLSCGAVAFLDANADEYSTNPDIKDFVDECPSVSVVFCNKDSRGKTGIIRMDSVLENADGKNIIAYKNFEFDKIPRKKLTSVIVFSLITDTCMKNNEGINGVEKMLKSICLKTEDGGQRMTLTGLKAPKIVSFKTDFEEIARISGFTNYPASVINTWLLINQEDYDCLLNTTRNIHKITKDKDKTAKHIVDGLQEYLHERVEADTKGLYNELLSWTLEFVEWREIADRILEDVLDEQG